jgi:hypothetical protein
MCIAENRLLNISAHVNGVPESDKLLAEDGASE